MPSGCRCGGASSIRPTHHRDAGALGMAPSDALLVPVDVQVHDGESGCFQVGAQFGFVADVGAPAVGKLPRPRFDFSPFLGP